MQKINCFKQNGLPVSKYYHKLNSLWREFDILTKLTPCTCDAKTELSKHNQLMKLMQLLMGLDDVYQPIRSTLLTQTELPDVTDACVIVCREESHRGLGSSLRVQKPQKNSSGIPFINEQTAKLMSLIGDKPSNGIHSNMAAKIRKVRNLKLSNNIVLFDVLVIPEYCDLKRENVLWTRNEAGGLYVFNTEMQIGEENFPEGNVPKNNNVPTYFFDTEESNGLRRSSRQSKHPAKLNDYVQIVKL
ncbi:hypothetical protein Tco_0615625, partial [Tanacetum coccineum]